MDRVTVLGAGLAGVSAAGRLRELGYDGRLTLVGGEDRPPYDRPPLSKDLLLGTKGPDAIALRPPGWYDDNAIELRLGEPASELVVGDDEVVLLATGGVPRRLPVPGADHPAVTTLRTVADAEALSARLLPGARVGVVGAGLIGSEVAAAAVARGCAVTLLDPAARPLERVVGPEVAEVLHAQHRRHGVDLVLGAVSEVEDRGAGVRLRLADGASVDCDVVVVGIGIEPEVALAAAAGLAVDRGVLVDEAQRTSHPRVFAAGDVARPLDRPATEHWDAAVREGRAAAEAMLGREPVRGTPWFWSDRYGTRVEVVGELPGGPSVVRGSLGGSFVAFALRDGAVVGAVAVDRGADMPAVRRLVERGVVVSPDLLADESADLRGLVRAGQGVNNRHRQ
ncbi:NAD(P)/FAD-dependent oxidoreductase [Actinosynnema sp. NPDC091369]